MLCIWKQLYIIMLIALCQFVLINFIYKNTAFTNVLWESDAIPELFRMKELTIYHDPI